jgi:hypothetical protein
MGPTPRSNLDRTPDEGSPPPAAIKAPDAIPSPQRARSSLAYGFPERPHHSRGVGVDDAEAPGFAQGCIVFP